MDSKGLAAAGARAWAGLAAVSARLVHPRRQAQTRLPASSPQAGLSEALDLESTRLRLGCDEALLQRVLEQFALELDDWERELESGMDQADAPAACRLAHAIKGAAATVGAHRLRVAAQAFEAGLRSGSAAPGGELARACLGELRQTRAALSVLLASPRGSQAPAHG